MIDLEDINMIHDLQTNLNHIYRQCGSNFEITYKGHTYPCWFACVNGVYELSCDMEKREQVLLPFYIIFQDFIKFKKNNNCYIHNIHKTETESGSQIMDSILELLRRLRVHKVHITDGTRVPCGENKTMFLSLFKIIEKGQTYY